MNNYLRISVSLANGILFFMPSQRCSDTGLRVIEIESMVSDVLDSDYITKGKNIRRTLKLSGEEVRSKGYDEASQMLKWKPILEKAQAKNIGAFHSKSLSFQRYIG